jgi:hypothetical protein
MTKKNLSAQNKTGKVKREIDPIPRRYCLLTMAFGFIIVAGFLFAARQHFGAINLGIENSELRKQRDELSTEQRRLKISREIAYSPLELEKAALKMGLQKTTFVNISETMAYSGKSTSAAEETKIDVKKLAVIDTIAKKETKSMVKESPVDKSNPFPKDNQSTITGKDGTVKRQTDDKSKKESKQESKQDRRTETALKSSSDKSDRSEISRYSKL